MDDEKMMTYEVSTFLWLVEYCDSTAGHYHQRNIVYHNIVPNSKFKKKIEMKWKCKSVWRPCKFIQLFFFENLKLQGFTH